MEFPPKLYKLMKKVHAEGLLTRGEVRVGTLHGYRKIEGDERGIGDPDEGRRHHHIEGIYGRSKFKNLPTVVRRSGAIDTHPEADFFWDIRNCNVLEEHPDMFVYSTSLVFAPSIMTSMQYDTCLEIYAPERFFDELTRTMWDRRLLAAFRYFLGYVQYSSFQQDYRDAEALPAFLRKNRSFASQMEFRCVWEPTGVIQPLNLKVPELARYCRIVNSESRA